MHFSYVIFLSETWINRENVLNDDIKIVGYGSHFNCYNKKMGKRTAVFYKMFVNAKRLHCPPLKLGGYLFLKCGQRGRSWKNCSEIGDSLRKGEEGGGVHIVSSVFFMKSMFSLLLEYFFCLVNIYTCCNQ